MQSGTPGAATISWKKTSFSLSAFSNGSLLCVLLSEFSERVEQQMRTQQFRNIVREFQFHDDSASTPLHVLSDQCVI